VALVALGGCSARKNGEATQVAAKVNKEEISVHQVNFMLQRQPGLKPEQLDSFSRKTLDALIDQELAVQAASEQRVDREPAVLQAIEAARREIVARAYAERLADSANPPTKEEVAAYYASHPSLFADRRIYNLVETALEATPSQQQSLQAQVIAAKNADELTALLRTSGLRFGTRQTTQGADALPLQAVDRMAALREGQSYMLGGPTGARILTITAVRRSPLTEEEARPMIEKFLLVERKQALVEQQIRSLRSAARIEYQGKFAQASTPAAPVATTAPAAAAVPVVSASSASGLDNATLNKGMAGLK
jgi:EpsD family peptidyl-prolyl cis-trans isomerase